MRKILLLTFCCTPALLWAQEEKNETPNSLAPATTRRVDAPRHHHEVKLRKANVRHTARYEFYDRVERAAKEKKRILRKLAKPQFSDPAYFGHKRKPKKRPAFLMRYCDECGIRH